MPSDLEIKIASFNTIEELGIVWKNFTILVIIFSTKQ